MDVRHDHPADGWTFRGYLPHLNAAGQLQHVTFHLADSLPVATLERLRDQLAAIPPSKRESERRKRIEALLDAGLGSCALADEGCARAVEEGLLFAHDSRYQLLAWVVMPTHVHVLLRQLPNWPLGKVVQSWKRHTARQIHLRAPSCTRPIPDPVWQRDYWDRYIRDESHYVAVKRYIEENPVKAGLVQRARDWLWGSARFEPPSAG